LHNEHFPPFVDTPQIDTLISATCERLEKYSKLGLEQIPHKELKIVR
jgi:hypothetical protein